MYCSGQNIEKTVPKRVLIFIVAYNAEDTIASVLSRIPKSLTASQDPKVDVLVIDDCSTDLTTQKCVEYKTIDPRFPLTIKTNPKNLGYGGNQKVGYQYAINHGYDIVVLLHGDAQYAPEEIPNLIDPLITNSCDLVLGSRMIDPNGAKKGHMPLYKLVGNHILSRIQNKLTNQHLTEWHSGFRAYCCKALKEIAFKRNSNYFDFDTQIILQFLSTKARIQELPVSTHYGTEICHVNTTKYVYLTLKECLSYFLSRHPLTLRGVHEKRSCGPRF